MGRSAVVFGVGAGAGLGAALCRKFAREGLHVFANARSAERIEAVVDSIRATGGAATAVPGDVTDEAAVDGVFQAAEQEVGLPEVVVFNVGNNRFRPLLEMDGEFFEGLWRVCCFGGFLVGRAAARCMVPAGGGSLIFTGATASMRARPPFTAFAAAKAGLRAVAHGMAREFGPQGLHVGHVVIDGAIDGDAVNSRFPQIKERLGADGMLAVDAIADTYWNLHQQDRSAWTLELDLRPHKESF